MSDVMELSLRGASNLEKLMRAVLLDADNKIPAERLRIVGAVAEGAIIEQGSNANGDWVRLADGTQVCLGRMTYNGLDTSLQRNPVPITFPAVFANTNFIVYAIASGYPGTPGTFVTGIGSGVSTGTTEMQFYCFNGPPTTTTLIFRWIAIGRWKA